MTTRFQRILDSEDEDDENPIASIEWALPPALKRRKLRDNEDDIDVQRSTELERSRRTKLGAL